MLLKCMSSILISVVKFFKFILQVADKSHGLKGYG